MLLAFDESAIFPPADFFYDYGGSLGSGMDTTVTTKDSGYVTTYSHYAAGRRRYENIGFTGLTQQQLALLKSFYWCRSGSAMGFRFLDCYDFSSATDGQSLPLATDQPVLADENGHLRLTKSYAGGLVNRWILKPFTGPIQFGVNGVVVQSAVLLADGGAVVNPTAYTVDTTTGIISGYTPTGALTAGYYFHTPVRFDSSPALRLEDYNIGTVSGITLRELLYSV